MKTIYARLGDLQLGETLEDGTSIGTIGKALKAVGIDIQTTTGDLRDMGDVIEELMGKWNTLNTAEKQALAVKLAGKYQYNNLMALLENSQMYYDQLEASQNSLGTINEQEEIYLDSISAKMAQMQAEFEGLINNLFNPDDLKPFMDGLTKIIGQVSSFVQSIGGGGTLATGIGGLALSVFSSDIARGITNVQRNYERRRTINQNFDVTPDLVKEFGASAGDIAKDSATYQYAARMSPYASMFNEKELEAYRTTLHEIYMQESARAENLAKMNELVDQLNHEYQTNLQTTEKLATIENGRINVNQQRLGQLYDSGFKMSDESIKGQQSAASSMMVRLTSYRDLVEQERSNIEQNGWSNKNNGKISHLTTSLRNDMKPFLQSEDPAIRQLAEQIAKMNTQGLKTEEGYKAWSDRITELIRAIDKFAKEVDKNRQSNAKELKQNATEEVEALNNNGEMYEEGNKANEQLGKNQQLAASNRMLLQSYLDLSGGVLQLTYAWDSLKAIGSIWDNDDLSVGDKMLRTIQNLVPAVLMFVNALQTMKAAQAVIAFEKRQQKAWLTEATTAETVANNANTQSLNANILARQQDAVETSRDTVLTTENTVATQENTAANAANAKSNSFSGGSSSGKKNNNTKAGKGASIVQVGGNAKNASTTNTKILGKVFGFLGRNIGKIFTGVGIAALAADVVSTITTSSIKKTQQELKEKASEKADEASSLLSSTDSSFQRMLDLKAEYDKTGSASQDFVTCLKDLGEQFEINDTEALLASQSYDELANKVEDARVQAQKEWFSNSQVAVLDLQNKINEKEKSTDGIFDGLFDAVDGIRRGMQGVLLGIIDVFEDSDIKKWLDELSRGIHDLIFNFGIVIGSLGVDIASTISSWSPDIDVSGLVTASLKACGFSDEQISTIISAKNGSYVSPAEQAFKDTTGIQYNADTLERDRNTFITRKTMKDQSHLDNDLLPKQEELSSEIDLGESLIAGSLSPEQVTDILKEKLPANFDAGPLIKVLLGQLDSSQLSEAYSDNQLKTLQQLFPEIGSFQETGNTFYEEPDYATIEELKNPLFYQLRDEIGGEAFSQYQSWSITGTGLNNHSNIERLAGLVAAINGLDYTDEDVLQRLVEEIKRLYGTKVSEEEFVVDDNWSQNLQQSWAPTQEHIDELTEELGTTNEQIESVQGSIDESAESYGRQFDDAAAAVEDHPDYTGMSYTDIAYSLYPDSQYGDDGSTDEDKTGDTGISDFFASKDIKSASQLFDVIGQGSTDDFVANTVELLSSGGFIDQEDYEDLFTYLTTDDSSVKQAVAKNAKQQGDELISFIEQLLLDPTLNNSNRFALEELQKSISSQLDSESSALSDRADLQDSLSEIVETAINIGMQEGAFDKASSVDEFWDMVDEYLKANYPEQYNALHEDITSLRSTAFSNGKGEKQDSKELGFIADQYYTGGNTKQGDYYRRQSYEAGDFSNFSSITDNMSDASANAVYGTLSLWAKNMGLDVSSINPEVVNGVITEILRSGSDLQTALDAISEGMFDLTADVDDASEYARSVIRDGDYRKWRLDRLGGVDVDSGKLDLSVNLSETDLIKEPMSTKSAIGGLMSSADQIYQDEENGGRTFFTNEEALDILQANPEYIKYLDEVEGGWQLNTRAVLEYEQAVKDSEDQLDELAGKTNDMSAQQESISAMAASGSSYAGDEENPGYLDILHGLNYDFSNGLIGPEEFLGQASDSFNQFFNEVRQQADEANQSLEEFFSHNDDAADMANVFADELYTGMQKLNKQYAAGKINMTQYAGSVESAAENSIELRAAQLGVSKGGHESYKALMQNTEEFNKLDDATKAAVMELASMEERLDSLSKAKDFSQFITDNFDTLTQIFSDTGQVLDSAIDENGKIKAEYNDTIAGLATAASAFYQQDTLAAQQAAQRISNLTGKMYDTVYTALQTTEGTIDLMSESPEVAGAVMQATMEQTQESIGLMAEGIGDIITGVVDAIASIDGGVTGTAELDGETEGAITATNADGTQTETIGSVHIPNFHLNLSGSGSSSAASIAKSQGYKKGGTYTTEEALAAGADFSDMVGQNGYVTAWTTDTGETIYVSADSTDAGAHKLSSGLAQLLGVGNARMSQYGTGSGAGGGYTPNAADGSGGGSGGGGGGDGSGSSYEPKSKDEVEDEIDRYEKVQTLLDAIVADYEKLNSEADRLVGYDYADNITEQIKLLRQQIDLQKQKLEIQKDEAKEYADELKSLYGIQINEDGFIQNYAERYKFLLGNLNTMIAQYNAETTEEGQEALDEQISDAQDAFDKFNDLIDKYDELVSSSIKDTQQQLEDLEDSIEDLNITAFQKAVDAADNIKDLNEALIEFNQAFSGRQSDDPFRAMETSVGKLAGYFDVANNSANEYYDTLIGRYKQLMSAAGVTDVQKKFYQSQIDAAESARRQVGAGTMEELGTGYLDLSLASVGEMLSQIDQFQKTGTSSIFGKDSADLYDTAKTVFDQATSLISDYEGEVDDLRSSIVDAIDDVGDRMEERITQLENVDEELQHISDIVELLHGDQSYDQLNQVLAARNQNYQQQITETQQQLEYWQDLIEIMKEGSDEYKAVQEKITDTQSKLNDLVKDSLDTIQQQYTNTVNKITSQWTKNALGNDLDWISQEWELINRNADYYLDDVNKAYNIQKLQSKYLDLLDGSNTLDVQQKITAQMNQQLGYLRDKAKLSEYDVAYAEAQLEILQKQIALQEAQANKSQMKLRRDSQGNYNYVYTADEGDVRNAQGDLLDAQNNAYNLSKDQMKQAQADSISALQDAMSLISDIWTNANLTLEEKQERTRIVIDSLKEYLAGTSEQLSTSQQNIINDFIGMCDTLLDENKGSMKDVYDQIIAGNDDAFAQIDRRWQTSISDWLQHMDQFNSDTDDMFSNLVDNANDYQDNVDKIADLVKADFDDISDAIQNCTDKTKDLAASNADFINQLKNDSGVIKDYESRLQEYADKIGDAQNSMRAYQQQVNELQSKLTAKEQENSNLSGQIQDLYNQLHPNGTGGNGGNGGSGNGGSGGGFGGTGYSSSELAMGIAQNIYTYGTSGGWDDDPTRRTKLTDAYGSDFASAVQQLINDYYYSGRDNELANYDSSKFSSYNLIGYDTGGYTGEWSDGSGKLALLHSKEIVLNANDTENILKAVDAVRSMTADMKGSIFGSVMSGTAEQLANALATSMSENIEQTVNVHAEFPNATQAEDIRMAILGLADRASQYAHSRR